MWVEFLFVLSFTPRGFSPATPVVSFLLKPTFSNSNSTRNQVDEEPQCGCATSKSLLFSFVHRQSSTTTSFSCLNENEPTGSTDEGGWCPLTTGFFTVYLYRKETCKGTFIHQQVKRVADSVRIQPPREMPVPHGPYPSAGGNERRVYSYLKLQKP